MDFSTKLTMVAGLTALTLVINLPFGYLRKREKKYSLRWFLFIHIPIPFIFLARISANLNYHYVPLFVLAAIAGQILGGKVEL